MILDKIVKSTEERLKIKKANLSFECLKDKLNNTMDDINKKSHNSFEKTLKNDDMSFICEVKRASPSKGIICSNFDHVKIANEYENAGASAISILTEPYFFKGEDTYLSDVVNNVNIPVLRKDFVIDEYMIYEAKLLGASAILLISSILNDNKLKKFVELSYSLDICPLVEIHTNHEIKKAIDAGAKIIGINNRNLKNFNVNVKNSVNLKKNIPEDIRQDLVLVSESGIKSPEDIKLLDSNSFNGVLIGESLMRSNDKKLALKNLQSLL
jgi:indole-3-glycerol phosphate synthase